MTQTAGADGPLAGIRILEVAMYGFVPSAGAVLADWAADAIKVVCGTADVRSSVSRNCQSLWKRIMLSPMV